MGGIAVTLARLSGSFLFYALITAICFWPQLPHLDSMLLGPPEDNLQDLWNSWYATVGHTRGASFFFTDLIKFPEGTSLYYHSFAYPQVFLVWLGSKVLGTGAPTLILLHNLVHLLSFPLAGAAAYFVARHVTGSTWSALIGGFVFAFNPSHVQHAMHHLHVASIGLIPFFVLSYWLAIERRSVAWLTIAVIVHALNALSSWYYLFFCGYFIAFHTIYDCVKNRALPRGWALFAPIAAMASVSLLLSPWLVPMVREAAAGNNVNVEGIDIYVADLLGYVSFPPHHIFAALTERLYGYFSGNMWEATVYLGIANIGLAVWLLLNRQKSDRQTILYLAAGIAVFAIVASGGGLHILGYKLFSMPGALLSEVPFFRNVRTPSRAIVFVYLFLAVAVSMAVQLLARQSKNFSARQRVAFAGVLALIAVDFYPVRVDMTPWSCSPGLAVIRDDPEPGFGVLNLPSGYIAGNADMAEQLCHDRPIVQGNLSREVSRSLRNGLETTDLEAQRRQLIGSKVKYIVLRRFDTKVYRWHAEDGVRDSYPRTYRTAYADADLIVLQVY